MLIYLILFSVFETFLTSCSPQMDNQVSTDHLAAEQLSDTNMSIEKSVETNVLPNSIPVDTKLYELDSHETTINSAHLAPTTSIEENKHKCVVNTLASNMTELPLAESSILLENKTLSSELTNETSMIIETHRNTFGEEATVSVTDEIEDIILDEITSSEACELALVKQEPSTSSTSGTRTSNRLKRKKIEKREPNVPVERSKVYSEHNYISSESLGEPYIYTFMKNIVLYLLVLAVTIPWKQVDLSCKKQNNQL